MPSGCRKLRKQKPCKAKPVLNITVVDKHHHVLKPIWDAVASKALPSQGVKLLHFDSHPDMGVIGSNYGDDSPRFGRLKVAVPKIFANRFNHEEVLQLSGIATWVPTLVAQGLVDEVIWCAGWWCEQFPCGTFDLFVGQTAGGLMKIAIPGDKRPEALDYFLDDDCVVTMAELQTPRPWKLHVIKFQENCTLSRSHVKRIASVCGRSPWILDIDEDYLSCQNPFTVDFTSHYGQEMYDSLVELWGMDADEPTEYQTRLENILSEDRFLLPVSRYERHEDVRVALDQLVSGGLSKKEARDRLLEFREQCRVVLPKEDGDYLHAREVKDASFMVQSIGLHGVPHHISTLNQILKLLRSTQGLFSAIRTAPRVVTVATSRADEYTPENQSHAINMKTLDLLKDSWKRTRRPRIIRRDFRSQLSIDDGAPDLLALFLSRGKVNKLDEMDEDTSSDEDF